MKTKAFKILEAASDKTLAASILATFMEVERNYYLRLWKTSELDAGHFVEAVRRFIDMRFTGTYTPIGKTLSSFNDAEIKRLESYTGAESYRIHIPRVLYSINGLRNKRGVGHLGLISPNYMDATFILSSCKWILAEILRQESSLKPEETSDLVEQVISRPLPGIWDLGAVRRILSTGMSLREDIILASI